MAPRKRYQLDRVTVEPREQRSATWTFPGSNGREPVSGTEHVYAVIDENQGGQEVGGVLRGLSLAGSRLDGSLDPDTLAERIQGELQRVG